MDYSSAHVIFIIQYCNRLFSIAVDYTTDLVPKTNAFALHSTPFVQLRKTMTASVVLIKAPLNKCLTSTLQRAQVQCCFIRVIFMFRGLYM